MESNLGYEWAKSFKILKNSNQTVRFIPNRQELKVFFNELPNPKAKTLFLMLASSGLRVSKLPSSKVDLERRMLIPTGHKGATKHSYISFFNEEAEHYYIKSNGWGKTTRRTLEKWFKATSERTKINITLKCLGNGSAAKC